MKRFLSTVLLLASTALCASAQQRNPVQWTVTAKPEKVPPGSSVFVSFAAKMEPGWHIYALTSPAGGPTPTTIKLDPVPATGEVKLYQPKPETKFDPNFSMNVDAFEGDLTLIAEVPVSPDAPKGPLELPFLVRYQACTDKECLPRKANLSASVTVDPGASAITSAIPAGYTLFTGQPAAPAQTTTTGDEGGTGWFLAVAFGFGLASIFTPCVFPMIPITLSFFLNRPGITRAESLKQALFFCAGIVVLFTVIGLSVAAIIGPFGVVQLGSNPWVNAFVALVFLVFGLSLLGAYEITLPSGLLTKLNAASERGGIAGTLLMGLTFCLTSFACVGPFVGTLLAGSVQRGGFEPALGMMLFAAGLASPFFFLALFPSYLQRLPRSGGWMTRVKVVLGFVILAVMFKYLSSIDQVLQWNILTRERFLAIWFVMFGMAGLYLLGLLRMEGIRAEETVGVGRALTGAVFLIFAFSLLPGMFGARLGELDAYVPLASPDGRQSGVAGERLSWLKNDFNSALEKARAENKLVFVSFTGYACTNCHWMKANMFTRPEIADAMGNFVLVELYTDGTDAASEENQKLQESRFGTAAIPFYAIFDANGKVVSTFAGLTRQAPEYLAFLKSTAPQTARAQ